MGSWETNCKQDPRFNLIGRAFGITGAEEAITEAILAKQKELGLSNAELDKLEIRMSFCKD